MYINKFLMNIFKIIFVILLFFIPTFGIAVLSEYYNWKQSKNNDKRSLFNPLRYKSLLAIVIVFISSFFIVNYFFKPSDIINSSDLIEYGKRTNTPFYTKQAYYNLIKKDSFNTEYHYNFIKSHFQLSEKIDDFDGINDYDIFKIYRNKYKAKNIDSLIGIYGLGLCNFYCDRYTYNESLFYLERLKKTNFYCINKTLGDIYFGLNNFNKAKYHYNKELKQNKPDSSVLNNIFKIELKHNNVPKALTYVYNKNTSKFVNFNDKIKVLFKVNDIKTYTVEIFKNFINNINIISLIATILITLVWLFYVYSVDLFEKEKLIYVWICLLLGMIFTFGVYYIYSFIDLFYHYEVTQTNINNFLHNVFRVGMVEELMKIIPVLLILTFSRTINEPFDYLFYACVSALGFAFIENLVYINNYSIEILHGRALMATVGHMIDTSIVAYGLMLAKYKYNNKNSFFIFLLFLFLGSLTHGTYNYLLQENLSLVFAIFFLLCIKIWVTLFNNALNNSSFFDYKIILNDENLKFYVVVSFSIILAFEYITIGYLYSPDKANASLSEISSVGFILILYLSVRLTNYNLVKGKWLQFEFSLNPFKNKFKSINYVGIKVLITPYNDNIGNFNKSSEPIKGEIVNRHDIYFKSIWNTKNAIKEDDWFEVKLENEIEINDSKYFCLFIKFKEKYNDLNNDQNQIAYTMISKKEILLPLEMERNNFVFLGGAYVNKAEN